MRRPPTSEQQDRPRLLMVLFWVVTALTAGFHLANIELSPWWVSLIFGVNLAVVIACWRALPWRGTGSIRDLAWPAAFMVASLALGFSGSAAVHAPLLLIGVANVALVKGLARGAVLVGIVLLLLSGFGLVAGMDPWSLLWEVVSIAVMAAFVLAMAAAVLEARAAREQARELLGKVRELTLAEERARMAREMHDSLGQQLTVIKLGLENAQRFRNRDEDRAWSEVAEVKEVSARALQDTRRWVRALRPLPEGVPVDSGALAELTESFAAAGLSVSLRVDGEEVPIEAALQRVLYRALQEGLTNAVRHGNATRVEAVLTFGPDVVSLQITDDGGGVGESGQVREGFGLSSLRERAESLGGSVRTDASVGFALRVELPAGVQVR